MSKTLIKSVLFASAVSTKTFTTTDGGPTFTVTYDSSKSKFKFEVNNVAPSSTVTLAFSATPASTQSDLAVFTALGNGILSDKWGTWTVSSTTGDTNSWSNTVMTPRDGNYNWVSYRLPNTLDAVKDS